MKRFIKSHHEPRVITIHGEEYPAIFSMAALAAVEEQAGIPYAAFFEKLGKNECTAREQAIFICACLNAGGTEVTVDDLIDSLDIQDFVDVLAAVAAMVGDQTPEGDGKNVK